MGHLAYLHPPQTGPRANNVNYLGAARCRRKFELYYPGGFADDTYLVAERSNKERAHLEWRQQMSQSTFRKLLARGEYREIADTALRIESRANLLFAFERMALRDAVRTSAGARLFAHELHAFLNGRGTMRSKFQDWRDAIDDLPRRADRKLTWPLLTVFGFIARPDKHLFLKPRVTRKAALAYGFDFEYHALPAWPVYDSLLTFAAIMRRDLDRKPGFKARDMIDLQSFIWVQGADEYQA